MLKFDIEFVGMYDRDGNELPVSDGYHADDFLPGYAEQVFENESLAKRWIESTHKGADVDGVEARFITLPLD